MIVIGVDVHKQSVTAVAVDEAGRMLDERTVAVGSEELIGWAAALDAERLWALEDCRLLTPLARAAAARPGRGLGAGAAEADGAGASRWPDPRQVGPDRRARGRPGRHCVSPTCRGRGPMSGCYREIKLLVDHRDDLVDERRRTQQRLRWHLHELDPTFVVPLAALDRAVSSSASAAGWPAVSRTCRCGSHVSSSTAAAR